MKPLLVLGISSILVGTTQAQVQPQPRTRAGTGLIRKNKVAVTVIKSKELQQDACTLTTEYTATAAAMSKTTMSKRSP